MDADDISLLAAAPAVAYREYLYRPYGRLARWIDGTFDVVARPGQRMDRAPQPGDVLIEVTLGRMGAGRCVVLDGPVLVVVRSWPRLPGGQLILRPLPRAEMSEPMSVEPAEFGEALPSGWENAVFRAVFGGERRINALIKVGRDAGGPSAGAVRTQVLSLLRVPFPHPAQTGGIPCEQHARVAAPAHPDLPEASPHLRNFTGRYESVSTTRKRYFWAINQAGTALIAIRTARGWSKDHAAYLELRGDLQADGTAVLFRADRPEAFWGYLQEQPDRTIRWHDGSYLGPDGNRRFVSGDSDRDETLGLTVNNRPTMMESLWRSPDHELSELLRQAEWFPLRPDQLTFIETSVSSDLLRDLIGDYLATPAGITDAEKRAKDSAAARVANYIATMLWNGDSATKPDLGRPGQKTLAYGHHNNALLAAHVAKIWLAYFKLNYQGTKRSYLDWLANLIQEHKLNSLSAILGIPVNPAQATSKYRLTLEVASAGLLYAEGTLRVEKLTAPQWPGKGSLSYDVTAGVAGKPKFPSRDQVFDLVVTTPQEWEPDDFEGKLWLVNLTASANATIAEAGVKVAGGFLKSNSGMSIALEDGDAFAGPDIPHGKQDKPKISFSAEAMVGWVSRSDQGRIDMSRSFVASAAVTGSLTTATHFCFDSALLTPAARQLLRLVCADQLAALVSEASQVLIVGHTDRPDTDLRNLELSRLRADNVRRALDDILGTALKVPPERIAVLGLGELVARFKLRPEQLRNPADRRVDVIVNGTLVAALNGG
jgi:outer membrane protein OmpA-like peptidoglycan-associated protein